MLSTIHDIITATRCTEAVYHWIYPYAEDDSYYDYVDFQNLAIEHRVLAWGMVGSSDEGVESGEGAGNGQASCLIRMRQECVRLALLIYVNTGLVRGYPACAALIHNLVVALREKLVLASDLMMWTGVEDVLLWIVCIGVHCSEGEEEEAFFVERFADVVRTMRFSGFEEVKRLLVGFLWVEKIYGSRLRRVWTE